MPDTWNLITIDEQSKVYFQYIVVSSESIEVRQAFKYTGIEVNAEGNTKTGPFESNSECEKHLSCCHGNLEEKWDLWKQTLKKS